MLFHAFMFTVYVISRDVYPVYEKHSDLDISSTVTAVVELNNC